MGGATYTSMYRMVVGQAYSILGVDTAVDDEGFVRKLLIKMRNPWSYE